MLDRFVASRRHLHQLQYRGHQDARTVSDRGNADRLAASVGVFWALGAAGLGHHIGLGPLIVYAQAAVGKSMIAFAGLNWALDGAAARVAAVARLKDSTASKGTVRSGSVPATGMPAAQIRFRDVTFAYPAAPTGQFSGLDLDIPAGTSLAIVGLNGAGKTTLAKLLCRLYDPQSGAIEVDGTDLKDLDLASGAAGSRRCSRTSSVSNCRCART